MARVLWVLPYHLGSRIAATPIPLELARRGHQVVAMSMPGGERWFSDLGFGFRGHRRIPAYDWTRPESSPWRPDQFRKWFIDSIPDQVADVTEVLDAEHFDLVLADASLAGTGLAAESSGVPWASYVTFYVEERRPVDETYRSWWDEIRAAAGLGRDPRPEEESRWLGMSPHLTLLFGLPELSGRSSELPPYVEAVGPVVWDPPFAAEPPAWLATLGRERPAVLVSTSSAWLDEVDMVVKTAQGLADDDVDVVATVPAHHQLPPLPPNVVTSGYLPHGLLLEGVSVVVCSGGFGLVTRAACAGIPLVLVPRGGEGQELALAAARAGVAIALDHRKVTSGGLRGAVNRVRTDPAVRASTLRVRAAASRYDAPARSADLLEKLLALSQIGGRETKRLNPR